MKKYIFVLLLAVQSAFAATGAGNGPDLSGAALPIKPDRKIKEVDIKQINHTCAEAYIANLFKELTGQSCSPKTRNDSYYHGLYNGQSYDLNYDFRGSLIGCELDQQVSPNSKILSLFTNASPYSAIKAYYMSQGEGRLLKDDILLFFILKDGRKEVLLTLPDDRYVSLASRGYPTYETDEFGSITNSYYLGKDLVIRSGDAPPIRWRNFVSNRLSSFEFDSSEVTGCILKELSKF